MSIVKRKNHSVIPGFGDWWNDFFSEGFPSRFDAGLSMPAVNTHESETHYEVEVAIPGFDKKDIKVEVENGVVTVSAESKSETDDTNKKTTRREFSYQSFSRSFSLPNSANEENVSASYEKGILHLSIEKIDEAKFKKSKTIAVS